LSLIETAPVNAPNVFGTKVAVMVQDLPGATLDPQVLVWEKYLLPEVATPVMFSVEPPVFVSVVVSVLDWFPCTGPKLRLAGFSSTTVPVPIKLTVCGLPGALSAIDSVAVRDPRCVGLNVMLIVQLAPGATEVPQVWVWEKSPESLPVKPILVLSVLVP
jgi:hypothetical protein